MISPLIVFILVALTAVGALLMITANTLALKTENELRAKLKQLDADARAVGANPTDEEVAEIRRRTDELAAEIAEWKRSPFVVTRSVR